MANSNQQYFTPGDWDGKPLSFFDAVKAVPREIALDAYGKPWVYTVEADGRRTQYRRASRSDIALALRLRARQYERLVLDLGAERAAPKTPPKRPPNGGPLQDP